MTEFTPPLPINAYHHYLSDEEKEENMVETKSIGLHNYYLYIAKKYNRIILQLKYNKRGSDNCSICLNSMFNQRVLHTPCAHTFHINCIKSVFNTHSSMARYNCPLCRTNIYNSIQFMGYPPIYNGNNEFNNNNELDDEFEYYREELSLAINTTINLIRNSFSPRCFQIMVSDYPAIHAYDNPPICPICNSSFMELLYNSHQIDNDVYSLIIHHIGDHNSIIHLIFDIMNILNFDEIIEYIHFIYPTYNENADNADNAHATPM